MDEMDSREPFFLTCIFTKKNTKLSILKKNRENECHKNSSENLSRTYHPIAYITDVYKYNNTCILHLLPRNWFSDVFSVFANQTLKEARVMHNI